MAYMFEGLFVEVCTCKVLCPCWIGEAPDMGTCDSVLAWKIKNGAIDGVDVSGLSICLLAHLPENILEDNLRSVVYVDERASAEQEKALLDVYTGKLGGDGADLAELVGEVVAVERAQFSIEVEEGKGTLRIGNNIEAEIEPYIGHFGKVTALYDAVFSTIPNSPSYVSKAPVFKATKPELGIEIDLQGHNAMSANFRSEG